MGSDAEAADQVQNALGHRFARLELFETAITHRSLTNESADRTRSNNERLEFLGDSVLSAALSALFFEQFPNAAEGELTRRRADVVSEAGLADVAREIDLGAALRLGRGEERSGGRAKPRLLASALEACIGAVFLDGGWPATLRVVGKLFATRTKGATPGATDYKSRAQELVQARGQSAPVYRLIQTAGREHERTFVVEMLLGEITIARGQGRSKAEAEQRAALAALDALGETSHGD